MIIAAMIPKTQEKNRGNQTSSHRYANFFSLVEPSMCICTPQNNTTESEHCLNNRVFKIIEWVPLFECF